MMPLVLAPVGEENTVKHIGGGTVTVVSSLGGNVIVRVKESRVAISEELARKIMV